MRKLLLLLAALTALVVVPAAPAKTITVEITKKGFSPSSVSVAAGDTVVWKNADTATHQVVSDTGAFQSPVLTPGQSYSFQFFTAGSYPYHGALHPQLKGTVVVSRVFIEASRSAVTFGGDVTISGSVSSGNAGEKVTIVAKPQDLPEQRIDVTTGANGEWTYTAQPRIQTRYEAQWQNFTSQERIVVVRPRVTLHKVGLHTFETNLLAARSFAGQYLVLERYRARTHSWVSLKRVYLKATQHETVSIATFKANARRHTKLRMFLPRSQAGFGYLAAFSSFIFV